MINTNSFPPTRRLSDRSNRRHQAIIRQLQYSVPRDRLLSVAPEYREINSDNLSNTCSNIDTFDSMIDSEATNNCDTHTEYNTPSVSLPDNFAIDEFDFVKEFANVIIRHSIPYTAAEELMSIINIEFGYKRLPKSMKTVLRKINERVYDMDYKVVCECLNVVSFKSKDGYFEKDIKCTNCNKVFHGYNDLKQYSFFCSVPIKEQICFISETFEKPHSETNGILSLDLILAVDEIPIFKSVQSGLHVLVVFLAGMKKFGKDSIPIISTLYYGRGKPNVHTFFKEFIAEYLDLKNNPFETTWHQNTIIRLKCILADAPARAWLLGMLQFNGRYGCHKCLIEVSHGVYPMILSSDIIKRTHEETERIRLSTSEENRYGVIRSTPFSTLADFDYISLTAVEYIHCALLGVTKNLIKNIFLESRWGSRVFMNSTRPAIEYFDSKFTEIIVPSSIKRFRTLKEIIHFKSSEYENLLFYYAYSVFKEKMKPEFLLHIMILASALSKLLTVSASQTIEEARIEIDAFIRLIALLNYPDDIKRYNTHSLLHLPDDVCRIGGLNNYNAYGYENFLGRLKKLVRCSKNIPQQILYQLKASQAISTHSSAIIFKKQINCTEGINNDLIAHGISVSAARVFLKCVVGKNVFKAFKRDSLLRTADCNVSLDSKFYRIKFFVQTESINYLIGQEYKKIKQLSLQSMGINCTLKYCYYVRLDTLIKIFPIQSRLFPVILVQTSHNTLIYEIITNNN